MIKINNPEDCCGCTACASVCAHNAITMKPDTMGFLYPQVDGSKCVECGLCEKVCQFNDNYDKSLNLSQPEAYAARHKNVDEVMKSRSGATFVAISDYILGQGGIVYGAGYKDHFRVAHKRATTKEERDEFRGSKYVQSDLTDVFRNIKEELKSGKIVLFSGTPCQTSGLHSYVGINLLKNLVLIDIICHGVPSPYIWRDYLSYVESKYNVIIDVVNFRDKEKFGWKDHRETFISNKGKYIEGGIYTQLFYKHIIFRKSCGNCHFTNLKRPSDITLADFWGWEKSVPEMNRDDKGISLVLINTKKGKELFKTVSLSMNVEKVEIQKALQSRMKEPPSIHPFRDELEKDYSMHDFNYVLNKYVQPPLCRRILNKLKYGRSVL